MAARSPYVTTVEVEETGVRELSLTTLESQPPQFVLSGVRVMPTPGFTMHLDRLEVEDGRIIVKLTDVPPAGIVPQVLSPMTFSLRLGKLRGLRAGRCVMELRARRKAREKYTLVHALVVSVRV